MLKLRVKELAEARGWTLKDFQRELYLTNTSARRLWFSSADAAPGGRLNHIDLAIVEKLMDVFDVSLNEMFERT